MNDISMMGYPGMGQQQPQPQQAQQPQQQPISMQPHTMMNMMNTNLPPPGMMMGGAGSNTGNENMINHGLMSGNPVSGIPNNNSHQLSDQLINKNPNNMGIPQQQQDSLAAQMQLPMGGMPMGNGSAHNGNVGMNNNNTGGNNNIPMGNANVLRNNNIIGNLGGSSLAGGNMNSGMPGISTFGNTPGQLAAPPIQPNANANNPMYHPHLEDPSLMNNPIWKLQSQLATVSAQSVGQPNIYARQNAMKKYLATQVPPQNQTQQQAQAQSQIAETSKSLVDCTKQALMDIMAPDDSKLKGMSAPNTASTTTNSTISTPTTSKIDMNNSREQPSTPSLLLQHKKLSQYSIDEDDEVENRMVAPKDTKYNDQIWHAIDLSNLQIFNISPNLMKYDFLTRLYSNGNGLESIPSSIRNLKNLRVLDLSHNKLKESPKEIGNCYQLKYLYFFDNQITTLPWELGNLCNIQFLGCEGNPLDKELSKILTEKSFTGLIFYLRDNRPEVPYPHDRKFIEINADGEPEKEYDTVQEAERNLSSDMQKKSFTMLSYNTLCQHYATPKMYRYTPSWALSWDYRREKLKEQILNFNTDIICLQEVEAKTFEDFWQPLLEKHGYTGLFHAKTRAKTMQSKDSKKVDGCCAFYKTSKFKMLFKECVDFSGLWMKHKKFQRTEDYLNRAMNKDNVAIVMKLQHIQSGEIMWLVTTHLHWDPKFNDVKTFQVGVLLDHMETSLKEQNPKQDVKKYPSVICGDLNSYLSSSVYELFSTGRVQHHHDGKDRDFGYFSEDNFSHNLALKSSYNCIGESAFTNFTPSFTDVIDYIWFSSQALRVRGLLGEVDSEYVSNFIGFPNDKFPSDHIPLLGRYEFLKSNNTQNSNSGSRKV